MAAAIDDAVRTRDHLLVQAGTGTGKSLGYLIPILLELANGRLDRVVIATATLALQAQLAGNDIPAALQAVRQVAGSEPTTAILKGRTNYACRLRVNGGDAVTQQGLFDPAELAHTVHAEAGRPAADAPARQYGPPTGADTGADSDSSTTSLGAEVLALREWAQDQHEAGGLADRDDAPPHTERAWQQVSIPVRECLGVNKCPFGDSCFVEQSRQEARQADLVITNHALLAIDAMHGRTVLPDHDLLIIDEAHELVSRVTGAASAELAPAAVQRVARRAAGYVDDDVVAALQSDTQTLQADLDACAPGRVTDPQAPILETISTVRDASRRVITALNDGDQGNRSERAQVAGAVTEIFDVADRIPRLDDQDVVWVADSERFGPDVRVAPLTVAGLMRDRVLSDRTVIMTSATLKIGGNFVQMAGSVGLRDIDRIDGSSRPLPGDAPHDATPGGDIANADGGGTDDTGPPIRWRGLDVGSPFDYRRQGMLYVARHLPKPGRDGLSEPVLAEIAELVSAAGGRTLGLFSSRRAASAAAAHVREHLPAMIVFCQGELQLSELTRRFIQDDQACLFGTLSLWQGLDVPGPTCQQVIIDRIPFPRPDEPLMAARQQAVVEAGGNGFMAVPATHAALLLAQGSGRLIRRPDDRGVVAVLDPRLASARYAPYLRAGLPDMWPTTDYDTVIGSLRRLSGQA